MTRVRIDMTWEDLAKAWNWRPISNCPGRFVLSDESVSTLSPRELAGAGTVFTTFHVPTARDAVVVGCLDTGGLISYKRSDGSYVHTLNTAAGFARKLRQLDIHLESHENP